jgi:hypothetical protein
MVPPVNANYILKFRTILMPADRRACGILGNHRVLKGVFGDTGKISRP